jgi:hypothetical protein
VIHVNKESATSVDDVKVGDVLIDTFNSSNGLLTVIEVLSVDFDHITVKYMVEGISFNRDLSKKNLKLSPPLTLTEEEGTVYKNLVS